MDRNEFRKRMQDLKSYRQNNPDKGYWDWKVQAFAEGGENDDKTVWNWDSQLPEVVITRSKANRNIDERTDHSIRKPELPQQPTKRIYTITQTESDNNWSKWDEDGDGVLSSSERQKRQRKERQQEDWSNLVNGINNTLGTAAAAASTIYGGGWGTIRLLNGNRSSTIGAKLAKHILSSNAVDSGFDILQATSDPTSITNAVDLGLGLILGRYKDFSKPSRQFGEVINAGVNTINTVNSYSEGGEITDDNKQQQITNAITYALNRGNIDAAKSLMRRGTPNTNYYYPQSGAIDPVFSLYDTPVLGDAMTTTDAARYAMNGDWANAGLAMAGLILPGVVGKGIKKVNRHIPSVKGYKESVENQINRIMDPQDLQKQSDWNNMLYRSAEQVYEPDVINRAAATGTTDRLNRVRSMYENDLENMPKIRMTDELNGARGRVQLTKEAEQRYRQGIKPSDSDFEILVDRNIDPTQEVIDHELRHWNQYMEQGSPNINVMPTSTRSGVRPTSKNKLDPNHSDYYGKQGESEAYILNAYRDMKQKGYQINLKNFKKYYNSLKDIDTKKRAISQFSSLEDAYKWMQSMPLIGTAGVIAMNNKEQSN